MRGLEFGPTGDGLVLPILGDGIESLECCGEGVGRWVAGRIEYLGGKRQILPPGIVEQRRQIRGRASELRL